MSKNRFRTFRRSLVGGTIVSLMALTSTVFSESAVNSSGGNLLGVDSVSASADEPDLIVPSNQWDQWYPNHNQWVNTSNWDARVVHVHRCFHRERVDPDVEQGFGVDSDGDPYTSSAAEGVAGYGHTITSGLGFGVNGQPNITAKEEPVESTSFGELADEVSSTNDWNNRPSDLRDEAFDALDEEFIMSSSLLNQQKDSLEHGGVINVSEVKIESRIAASDEEQHYVRERSFDCGFDWQQRNSSGRVVDSGSKWFADGSYIDDLADPDSNIGISHRTIARGRHEAISSFSSDDISTGDPFAVYNSNGVFRRGISEAWMGAGCHYSSGTSYEPLTSSARQDLIDAGQYAPNSAHARERLPGASNGCGIRGDSIGQDSSNPQISHQKPYTELGQILWSYRYWDRGTGNYHSIFQSRAGGAERPHHDGSPTELTLNTTIWENIATPGEDSQFDVRPAELIEAEGESVDSIAFSDGVNSSHTPHRAYQVMHVVCNADGVDNVLNGLSGYGTHTGTDDDYSRLVVSRTYDGSGIPSNPDFGEGSGNATETPEFYSKECEFPPGDVGGDTPHTVTDGGGPPEEFGEGITERHGPTNEVAMLRNNVPNSIVFSAEESPDVDSGHISNVYPAYTLVSRLESSLGDTLNISRGSGDELFTGNDSGSIYLTNEELPDEYSSSDIELMHGFINRFNVSSPWTTEADDPEIMNVSYAWSANLMSQIPDSVIIGDNESYSPPDNIDETESVVVPILSRSNMLMGGEGNPSVISDVNATSGEGNDISEVIQPDDRNSSNSLVLEFIRSVSER